MIHEFGVRAGRISLNRMVELLATNPAKLFGLYPRKGTVAVGSDADLVVFDPEKQVTISASTHHSKADYNLYEGTTVTGSPEVVLLRGHGARRERRARRLARHRAVREARPVRRGAEAGGAGANRSRARRRIPGMRLILLLPPRRPDRPHARRLRRQGRRLLEPSAGLLRLALIGHSYRGVNA